jgi:hypothetical protein
MMRGGDDRMGMMGSSTASTTQEWRRPTTTPDGRPLPGAHNMGSTTNPGLGWGDKRGENHMMGSSTMMGSTTPPHGIRGFFKGFFDFFGGKHQDATSTASGTPPMGATADNEQGGGHGIGQFIQDFFGHLFGNH